MIKSRTIRFSSNKKNNLENIILVKNGNNQFIGALKESYGVYTIYFEEKIIYIGVVKGETNISDRISQHFRINHGAVHIQKYVTKKEHITKTELDYFYDLMIDKGKVIIYYFDKLKDKITEKQKTQLLKFESFCINYINPPCNKRKKALEFPVKWFKEFVSTS